MPNGSWASTKTAYDPCPAGWRVPDGGAYGIWATAAGQTGSIKISRSSDNGLDFSRTFGSGSTTIWYPAVGFYNDNGDLYGTGLYGDYWSVTPLGNNYAYFLDLSIEGAVNLTTIHHRKWGQGVRCMKI